MRRITAEDVTVFWKSAYSNGDSLYSKQEYVITLSQFMDDENTLKKIDEATVQSPKEEYAFNSKLSPEGRYQIKIVTRINDLTPSMSTEKARGFRADSGSVIYQFAVSYTHLTLPTILLV